MFSSMTNSSLVSLKSSLSGIVVVTPLEILSITSLSNYVVSKFGNKNKYAEKPIVTITINK